MGIQREDDQKGKTLNFYRNYFIMKDNLRKILIWKSHQWRYIATTIKIENLNSIKLFDQEGSFRHSFFLIIVSMGVHRNNDKKKLRSLWEFFCHERSFLDKIVLKLVSMAVHRNDDQKKTVKISNSFFFMKVHLFGNLFWKSYQWR